MECLQLDLFTGKPVAPVFESSSDYDDAARRAGFEDLFVDPCKGCELRDFCGSDDCAMHLFELDVNEPETDYAVL